jgi:UDP-glucose 4-epimerase
MSKAMMEKVMVAKSRTVSANQLVLSGTRYGNVMASRGSVIPLFIDQIKAGKPITITDPNMTRFMMTLEDAVDLVLYAFTNAEPGDIFVQKAPATTIELLATALKELYNAGNEIKIIGTRHGEKLYETLVNREEMTKAIDMGEYFRIPADNRGLNYEQYFSVGDTDVSKIDDYQSHNTNQIGLEETKKLLLRLETIQKDLNLIHA